VSGRRSRGVRDSGREHWGWGWGELLSGTLCHLEPVSKRNVTLSEALLVIPSEAKDLLAEAQVADGLDLGRDHLRGRPPVTPRSVLHLEEEVDVRRNVGSDAACGLELA